MTEATLDQETNLQDTPAGEAAPQEAAPTKRAKAPDQLAFEQSITPTHFAMYAARAMGAKHEELVPVSVTQQPLRGLNATSKTTEEKKSQAVLQVVESAVLFPETPVLVIKGLLTLTSRSFRPHSCIVPEFAVLHSAVMQRARERGVFAELARRYALTLASGSWTWRNAAESETCVVSVAWKEDGARRELRFEQLPTPSRDEDLFNFEAPEYVSYKSDLQTLAGLLEKGMFEPSPRCFKLEVRADLYMGGGSRVYPSQSWASKSVVEASKAEWGGNGSSGVTRWLAKFELPDGGNHAFINSCKVGNVVRRIDTWYGSSPCEPIPVEVFGANSHRGVALRSAKASSAFGALDAVASSKEMSQEQLLYYVALMVRGGVLGSKEA